MFPSIFGKVSQDIDAESDEIDMKTKDAVERDMRGVKEATAAKESFTFPAKRESSEETVGKESVGRMKEKEGSEMAEKSEIENKKTPGDCDFIEIESEFSNRASVVLIHEKMIEVKGGKFGPVPPYKTPAEGTVHLIFDNRHARWRGKTITSKFLVSHKSVKSAIFPIDGGEIDSSLLWNDMASRDAKPSFSKVVDDAERFIVHVPAGKKYTLVLPLQTGEVIESVECAVDQCDIRFSMIYQTKWDKVEKSYDAKRRRVYDSKLLATEARLITAETAVLRKKRAYEKIKASEDAWRTTANEYRSAAEEHRCTAEKLARRFEKYRAKYESQVDVLRDRVKSMELELERSRESAQGLVHDEESKRGNEENIETLNVKLLRLEEEVFRVQSIRDDLTNEVSNLRQQLHESATDIDIKEATISRLRNKLVSLESEMKDLRAKLVHRNDRNSTLVRDLVQENTRNGERIHQLEKENESAQAARDELVAQFRESKSSSRDIDSETKATEYEEKISQLKSKNQFLEKMNDDLQERIEESEIAARVKAETRKRLAARVALLQEKLKTAEEQLEMKSAQMVALEADMSHALITGGAKPDNQLIAQLLEANARLQKELKGAREVRRIFDESNAVRGEAADESVPSLEPLDVDVIDEIQRQFEEDGVDLDEESVIMVGGGNGIDLDEESVIMVGGGNGIDLDEDSVIMVGGGSTKETAIPDEIAEKEGAKMLHECAQNRDVICAAKKRAEESKTTLDVHKRADNQAMDLRARFLLMKTRNELKERLRELVRKFPSEKEARRRRVSSMLHVQERLDDTEEKLRQLRE